MSDACRVVFDAHITVEIIDGRVVSARVHYGDDMPEDARLNDEDIDQMDGPDYAYEDAVSVAVAYLEDGGEVTL